MTMSARRDLTPPARQGDLSPSPRGDLTPPAPLSGAARGEQAAGLPSPRRRGVGGEVSPEARGEVSPEAGREISRKLPIAFGALGGSVAWAIHLIVIYAVVPIACLTSSGLIVHLMTLLFGAAAGASIYVSWRGMQQRMGGGDARWLGAAGVILNSIFLLAILLEGVAAFVIDPCL